MKKSGSDSGAEGNKSSSNAVSCLAVLETFEATSQFNSIKGDSECIISFIQQEKVGRVSPISSYTWSS